MPLAAVVAVLPSHEDDRLVDAADLARRSGAPMLEAPATARSPSGRRRWLAESGIDGRNGGVVAWLDADGWALADLQRPEAGLVRAGAGRASRRDEPLGRAVGVHRRDPAGLHVVDATAGLGRDAATIAGWGCRVTWIERSAVLVRLLGGVRALRGHGIHGDAVDVLTAWPADARPDVVLLDPMHPPRRKSARVKHDLELLARLHGSQEREDPTGERALLEAAGGATSRVVVKRPPHAAPLGDRTPDHSVEGSRVRFDVYLT